MISIRPFRTIEIIVGNPSRSRSWKVIDVTVLSVLWIATICSIVIWLAGNAFTTWSLVVRILPVITVIATAQTWYQHPSPSKKARARMALERQYGAVAMTFDSEQTRGGNHPVVRTGPDVHRDIVTADRGLTVTTARGVTLPVRTPIVLRSTTVQVTGVLVTLVGTGLIMGGVLWLVPLDRRVWFLGVVACAAGLALLVTGLAFLQSHVEIRTDAIVTYWGFAKRSYAIHDLADSVLTQPRRRSDTSGGAGTIDRLRAGANALVFLPGYLLVLMFRVLAWIAMPGSSSGESLHLIPRLGGAICVPAISVRVDRQDDSAHHALAMIRTAIRSSGQQEQLESGR